MYFRLFLLLLIKCWFVIYQGLGNIKECTSRIIQSRQKKILCYQMFSMLKSNNTQKQVTKMFWFRRKDIKSIEGRNIKIKTSMLGPKIFVCNINKHQKENIKICLLWCFAGFQNYQHSESSTLNNLLVSFKIQFV